MNKNGLSSFIDHTVLKPETGVDKIKEVCEEALKYEFASVCINPCNVKVASSLLKGSKVKVCTVIGFPLGANTTDVKVFETKDAIANGAEEIDMVINIGKLKDKEYTFVKKDIEEVVKAAKDKAIVKVIIEACLLSEEEKIMACKLSKEAGADFVKTSTGFSTGGATVSDIKLMREVVGSEMGIKASGGVRSYEDAVNMINAGASRIGASASVQICENENVNKEDLY